MGKISSIVLTVIVLAFMYGCKEPDSNSSRKQPAVNSANKQDLSGGWNLVEIKVEGKVIIVQKDFQSTITFDKERKFHGSGGCNRFDAEYEIDRNGKMKIKDIMHTLIDCQDDRGVQERDFLATLKKITNHDILDGFLVLSDQTGENKLKFSPVAPT